MTRASKSARLRANMINRNRKSDKPHLSGVVLPVFRQLIRKATIVAVSTAALATQAADPARAGQSEDQGQMLGTIALAIAAYKSTSSQCYYRDNDRKIFNDVDAFYSRHLPDVWPRIRDSAPDDLPALQNTARILGAKSDCVALGNAVGLGLISALYVGQLDASVGSEMERLTHGGGRSISDPTPVEKTPVPAKSAADIIKEYNDTHPDQNKPETMDQRGVKTFLPRILPNVSPKTPHPGIDEPSGMTPVYRDTTKHVTAESAPPKILPELSDCLKDVDLSYNKNDGFARCYASALDREDKRLNEEYNTLKGRMYSSTKSSALALAQRTWIDFRDRWCAYEATLDEAPSPEVNRLSCLVGLTSDQANRLAASYLP